MNLPEIVDGLISNYFQNKQYSYLRTLIRTSWLMASLSRDYFWRNIFELAKERNWRFTFFVVTKLIDKYRDLILRLKEQGHEIGSHSHHHITSLKLTENQVLNELSRSREVLTNLGLKVYGYRSPQLLIDENHYPVLQDLGFVYSSSKLIHQRTCFSPIPDFYEVPVNFMDYTYISNLTELQTTFINMLAPGKVHLYHPYIMFHPQFTELRDLLFNKIDLPVITIYDLLNGKPGLAITFDLGF